MTVEKSIAEDDGKSDADLTTKKSKDADDENSDADKPETEDDGNLMPIRRKKIKCRKKISKKLSFFHFTFT